MSSAALTGLAVLGAIAAAAAREPEPEPPRLELSASFFAEDSSGRPNIRTFRERRREARARALGWLNSPLDDRELAARLELGEDPPPSLSFADFAAPDDGGDIVWNRPSLLTLGRDPSQPSSQEWLPWQAAVLAARRYRESGGR